MKKTLLIAGISLVSAPFINSQSRVPKKVEIKEYQVISSEPTSEEVYAMELLNRFRMDPKGEIKRTEEAKVLVSYDKLMFKEELNQFKPLPPLVINTKLLRAARNHSNYMTTSRQDSPAEFDDDKGFTGTMPTDRLKVARYSASCNASNYRPRTNNILESHMYFVVCWGGDENDGGMKSGRSTRHNLMNSSFTEGAIGIVPYMDYVAVSQELAKPRTTKPRRYAGGVIYFDKNANNFYDVGEGTSDIILEYKGTKNKVWDSGGFTIPISSKGGELAVTINGKRIVKQIAAGTTNVKVDFVTTIANELAATDAYLANVKKKICAEPDKARDLRIQLMMHAKKLYQDAKRKATIASIISSVASDVKSTLGKVKSGFKAGDNSAVSAELKAAKKKFADCPTMLDYLKEASRINSYLKAIIRDEERHAKRPLNAKTFALHTTKLEKAFDKTKYRSLKVEIYRLILKVDKIKK